MHKLQYFTYMAGLNKRNLNYIIIRTIGRGKNVSVFLIPVNKDQFAKVILKKETIYRLMNNWNNTQTNNMNVDNKLHFANAIHE